MGVGPQLDQDHFDVDAMMIYDLDGDFFNFGPGDEIIFSIAGPNGNFNGSEIFHWGPAMSQAQFLVHGGVTWDSFHGLGIVARCDRPTNIVDKHRLTRRRLVGSGTKAMSTGPFKPVTIVWTPVPS